jgi:1-deoxy-D-xylulose-5-phosphate synthase
MLGPARQAAALLAADGVEATVWDVRVVTPLDDEMLADAASHPLVVTVEDGYREGGAGTAIADRVGELSDGKVPTEVLGIPITYIPHGKPDALLADFGLDAPGIAAAARRHL